jgi:hypothetical protein
LISGNLVYKCWPPPPPDAIHLAATAADHNLINSNALLLLDGMDPAAAVEGEDTPYGTFSTL